MKITNKLNVSVIITGASTTGKTTLSRRLLTHFLVEPDPVHMTREKRDGEIEDIDAVFLKEEEFKQNFKEKKYLHSDIKDTMFNGVYYGCPVTWVSNTKIGKYSCFVSPTVKLAKKLKNELGNKIFWIHLITDEKNRVKRILERNPDINKRDFSLRIKAGNKKVDIIGHDLLIDTSNLKPWEIFFHAVIKIIKCVE